MEEVNVDIEYCSKCGYYNKYVELEKYIRSKHPSVNIHGHEGRRASFEITVNNKLVHSKIQTLAYPDFEDLSTIIKDVNEGKPIRSPCKQQPITSCVLS